MARRDYVHRDADGSGIVVYWNSEACIHSGVCLGKLPSVFRAKQRPWIDAAGADSDAIEAAVAACPSRALNAGRFTAGQPVPLRDLDDTVEPDDPPEGRSGA